MSSDLSRFGLDCERGLLSRMQKALLPSPGRLRLGVRGEPSSLLHEAWVGNADYRQRCLTPKIDSDLIQPLEERLEGAML